jgi:hypothetical protein
MMKRMLGVCSLACGLVLASALTGCGGSEASPTNVSPATDGASSAAAAPAGEDAPASLQGTWKLVTKGSPERGLLFVISGRHYRIPTRLANGDLVVNGDEILFFNAAICGLTLPEGVGRYHWSVDGDTLRFELVGKEPCGGRSDILANSVYRRIG